MLPHTLVLDCDPGHDDAIALLLALASPELELRGITCVAGNVPLERTAANARRVCELAGRADVPVFAGCARPMVRTLVTAEEVHGASGLDLDSGGTLPEPSMPLQRQHAVDFIVDTCLAAGAGSVTLCPTGPLTNIAMAMVKAPAILPKIREIVLMGGAAISPGNVTPTAEFNIYVDPHAAHVVFSAGVPLTMIGLDVTHQAQATPARLARFTAMGTGVGRTVAELLKFFNRYDMARYGFEGAPLHDPCVIAYLLDPTLFTRKHVHVGVVTDSGLSLGQTVADWWHVTDREPNCHVAATIDDGRFFDLLVERLARL